MSTNTERYRAARDHLVAVIGDYDRAVETFAWPRLSGPFNWATDWFDVIAHDPASADRLALWIVEQDGGEQKLSFAELAEGSDRVATWLAGLGVGKGDRVILMLGNQVELWESMLAGRKPGPRHLPAPRGPGAAGLADRISRGGARFVIANAVEAVKFAEVPGDYTRIAVGDAVVGWHS